MNEDLRNWFSKSHPEGNWKRYNTKGKAIGPCAREPGEPKPKCLSNEKAAKMSKSEIASAVKRKRKKDPVADRKGKGGKPKMVSNKIDEGLLDKIRKNKSKKSETNVTYDGMTQDQIRAQNQQKRISKQIRNDVDNKIYDDPWLRNAPSSEKKYHYRQLRGEQVEEVRYCPLCEKKEKRSECSYGPKVWDKVTVDKFDLSSDIEEERKQPDHEHSMIRSELETIRKAVDRLKSKMKGEGNVEAWVQSKITKAADYIDSAADYIDSGEHNVHGSMDEAKKDPCWKGYKQEGMKKKGNKMVPNCVPVNETSFEIKHTPADVRRAEKKKKISVLAQQGSTEGERSAAARKAGVSLPSLKKEEISLVDKIILEMESEVLNEKNVPTNPSLWSKMKSRAKAKFDVYPCVPLDSQAITKDGLKTYDELKIGENILTYNINKDILEWKPISHLHFYEQAPLKRIYKKTGFSLRATENHKWVVRSGNEYQNISLVETKDIHKRMRVVTCASLEENKSFNLFEEKWSKKDNWVEKVLSWNKEQREVYLASSIVYDGYDKGGSTKIRDRHTFGFTQKNDDHFWATLLSAYLNGYYVSFYEKTDCITGATIIRNKKYHSTQNLIIEDDGVEDVWCPTTENNTWVMVQNGLITITGNSAYANGWAAKEYKKAGGKWKSVSEEIEIQDTYGETFAVVDDVIKADPIVCERCGQNPCICDQLMGYNEVNETIRIPSKTGNIILVTLNWRGKYYAIKMFFPQVSTPTRRDVQDQIDKVYPGARVLAYNISDIKPGEQFLQTEDWQKVNRKDKTDGLSQKAVDAYRRENPGSKLQTAVTEKNPKGARKKRQGAFCSRSAGQRDMHNIDCSKTPDKPICKARRRWKC
jgi:hypothetical protein